MSNQPPIGVPQGAIRLNTDSQKLEFYAQDRWFEMATDVPYLGDTQSPAGARGFVSGGLQNPAEINNIDMITIPTAGNAIDFGNLTQVSRLGGTTASRTRAVRMSGIHGGSVTAVVDFWTISQQGDAVNFGDMQNGMRSTSAGGNQTRGILAAGVPDSSKIQYITIASLGSNQDFGDPFQNRTQGSALSSPTRCCFAAGEAPSRVNTIDFVEIATTGDAQDFGDITREISGVFCVTNATRGIIGGGEFPSTFDTTMDHITFASKGNALNFGELIEQNGNGYRLAGTASSPIRGCFMGGTNDSPASNTVYNVIQYVNMMTEGNSVDFGDLATTHGYTHIGNCSNAHGGL